MKNDKAEAGNQGDNDRDQGGNLQGETVFSEHDDPGSGAIFRVCRLTPKTDGHL